MSAGLALLKRIPYVGTALSAAPWVIAGLALGWGAIAQIGWERCAASREKDKAAQAEAILKANQKAERLSNELVIQQAIAMAKTDGTAVKYVDRIRTVQAPPLSCAADERFRIGSHGVRELLRGGTAPKAE